MSDFSISDIKFINLPGNIKQEFQPFKLGGQVSDPVSQSSELGGKQAQYFSFRGGKLQLGICPNSFKLKAAQDLSFDLLYGRDADSAKVVTESISINHIFNCLPGVKIREFQCDTPLNELLNFITNLQETVQQQKVNTKDKQDQTATKGKPPDNTKEQPDDQAGIAKKIWHAAKWIMQYLTCTIPEKNKNVMGALEPTLKDIDDSSSKHMAGSDDHTLYVIKMPFFFYYTFLSSTTTNVYEFPCKVDGDLLYSSDGTKGWGSTAFDLQVVQDAAHSINGIVGKVADALLGNIRMLYLAPWNAMEGWQTNEEDITIKVNLFNDTLEAAVANFICVNTLIGNNKYVQYGIFQSGPCLYDVQVEGSIRMFACTGKFKVNSKGLLRDPSKQFFDMLYFKKGTHLKATPKQLITSRKIKIPDVYELTMTFSSCLPATFNTWLFQYSNGMQIETPTGSSDNSTAGGYKASSVAKAIQDVTKDVTKKIQEYWPNDTFPSA